MSFFGVGLNRTSLAGFIIAMGMLVDNAIVVTDNAQIAIARGVNRRKGIDRRCHRTAMGITRSHFHCYLFIPATLSGPVFGSGNREAVVCGTRHFAGIELDTCIDTDDRIR